MRSFDASSIDSCPVDRKCIYRMVIIVSVSFRNIIMVIEQQSQHPAMPLEDFVRHFLESLTLGIDIAVGVIIAISIIRGFIMYVS
jgi:hypothetical protein